MPEWATAAGSALAVLGLAAAGAALGALVDAVRCGAPAGSAMLAPVAEVARLLRQARPGRPSRCGLVGVLLLGAALLQAAALPFGELGGGLVVVAALLAVALVCAHLLAREHGAPGGPALVDALWPALPPVLALAGPAVAGRGLRLADAVSAQQDLWSAVTMPVALVVLLAGAAAAVPASAAGLRGLTGLARLAAQAGRAALLAVAAVTAVPLLLGGGAGPLLPPWLWVLVKAVVALGVLVLAVRLLPGLRRGPLVRLSQRVALPLVLVQLAVVALVRAA